MPGFLHPFDAASLAPDQNFEVPAACEPLATSQNSGLVREVCGRASGDANFNLQVDAAHLHERATGTTAGIPMIYKVAIASETQRVSWAGNWTH